MNKQEFLSVLRERLSGLPKEDMEGSIDYYNEIIDDHIENGISEEEAVEAVGTMDEIVSQILSETSLTKLVKTKVKPNRALKAWEIVLLILGSPLWLSLLAAALLLVLAAYIVLWSAILVLYSVVFSFAVSALCGIFGSFVLFSTVSVAQGILFLGAGLVCMGIAILLFFGSNQITKGVLTLSKKMLLGIKGCFIRKGDA